MRILYVVSRPLEINTSASIRNRATIGGLFQLGHEVDLITTQFDNNHSNFDNTILHEKLNVEYLRLGGIQNFAKLSRRFKFAAPLKQLVYNIMSKFEIYDNLKGIVNYAFKMNIKDEKYDLIISSSDPKSSHLFICVLYESNLLKKTPWIQIWGDPFFSDITRNNIFMSAKIKSEETRLLKYANKVVYVSDLTLKEQKLIYPQYANKMVYEPIPYVKKEFYPIKEIYKESLSFVYCGDYNSNVRNIRPLYETIKNTKHSLTICGSSNITLKNTDRIKIYPRISFDKTKELESNCNVLVHLSNLKGTQIPGKIYQYSGTNKTILFILDGEIELLKKAFAKYERYLFCNNNEESILKAIQDLQDTSILLKNVPLEDFSPKTIGKKILEIR